MSQREEDGLWPGWHRPDEHTRLLANAEPRRDSWFSQFDPSHGGKEEQALVDSTVGERLGYNEYTTIDWLHDLVKDSYRLRIIANAKGLRARLYAQFDSCSGWIAVAVMGTLTACVAFIVDVCEATVSDWKLGYCTKNPLMAREACCRGKTPLLDAQDSENATSSMCHDWQPWVSDWWTKFAIYGLFALLFGVISATATTFTKRTLPAASPGTGDKEIEGKPAATKSLYLAAGSGIPEIKTFLSGFEIPHFFDFKVLFVKGFGAVFAVATGMCLGKEGPFVHISGCVGYLVAWQFPKYRDNGRKMREILSAAVAAGLSVAFGAPIGGVLFSYEEISTYFPRKILWRAFLCSMCAAIVLKALNPNGTGKLVLFETNYGTSYHAYHYFIFVLLGIAGGVWGGLFCRLNFKWSRWFRSYSIIKNNPVFEVFLVVLVTVLLQYPNVLIRDAGDAIIRNLLVNCHKTDSTSSAADSFVCRNEARADGRWDYVAWLGFGCLVKLVLTIVTFGAKVPSGIIIPALDAGALFGRLVGQWVVGTTISPGIFAMVGAAAFLAGVSRMTISLCVIMFELTGELEYVVPHMIAILVAKWVADALSTESVYDLAQSVLGHPFLDLDRSVALVQRQRQSLTPHLANRLVPPAQTMAEITVEVPASDCVSRALLQRKLDRLRDRGLLDAGVVLVRAGTGILQGYLGEAELAYGLDELGKSYQTECQVRVLGGPIGGREVEAVDHEGQNHDEDEEEADDPERGRARHRDSRRHSDDNDHVLDLSGYVDRTPMSVSEAAPMEYAVEAFGKLGLRHLMITDGAGTGRLVGVCLKKRMLGYLEELDH